ncbi:hypothetical protein [Micromonospora maritima]|uniref:hypothetical protein n=2 Tax=Micromonospora maritima TaxID=986711 RepID=UPI00157DC580|nr:hypothetical protein [Micromonospora maritima]
MAVAFVAASSGTSIAATSASFTTSLPVGWAAGDVAVLVGHVSATNLSMTTPVGWSPITGITNPTNEGTNSRIYAWYRVLQAGDTAPVITNSGSVTGGWSIAAYRGADQANPIGQAAAAGTAAVASRALPTLTGVAAGSALHGFAHARVASGTIPSGHDWPAAYTESIDDSTSRVTTSANVAMSSARRLVGASGSYGGESVAVTNAVSASLIAGLVEIRPAVTASTVALTPATLTLTAPAVSPAPLAVSVMLTPAVLTLSALAVSPAPLSVTVTLTAATLVLTAPALAPAPLAVAVALAPATMALSAQALTVSPLPVTITLTPASLALSAAPVSPAARPVTVTLAPATIALTAPAVAPDPLPVTVTLTPAALTLSPAPVAAGPPPSTVTLTSAMIALIAVRVIAFPATGPVDVTLTVAELRLTPVAPTVTPRPVNRTLTPVALRLTAIPVNPQPLPVTVALTPALMQLAAPAVVPVAKYVVHLAPALLRLDAAPVRLVFRAATHSVTVRTAAARIAGTGPVARVSAGAAPQTSVRRTV